MRISAKFSFLLLSVALFLSLVFAACGANSSSGGSSNTTSPIKIAFLMPCSTCADRFEKQDKPLFIQAVKALDPSIQVIANNAQGSSATQLAQTEAALTNGANVIVISPLDSATGVAVAAKASAQHVPVVSYDGLLTGATIDYYVSFPNETVGEIQGQFLLDHVKSGGTIVMINGSQDIDPGREFKAGAHKVLNPAFASGKLKLGFEADIHQFDPSKAQTAMEQALTKLNNKVDGVLVAITGQDASDTGLQRILVGDQTMTVYKAIKQEATAAAKIAVDLAKGDRSAANSLTTMTVNNGAIDVPSILLTPIVVTKENIFSTVIPDGFTTRARICIGPAAAQCP